MHQFKSATWHNCGNKGHIMKECRLKKYDNSSRRAFSNEKQDRSQKVASNSSSKAGVLTDAGIFIWGIGMYMLVDARATLSVLRKEIFDKIYCITATLNTMEQVGHLVLSSSSEALKVYWKLNLALTIDKLIYTIQQLLLQTYLFILFAQVWWCCRCDETYPEGWG